jgi:hypothetical protein
MKTLVEHFEEQRTNKSDLHQHIPTFYKYALDCTHITEFGVRWVTASWSFLKGLTDNVYKKQKKMVGVDKKRHKNVDLFESMCKKHNIEYDFIEGNSAYVKIEETDLLFIDSWHTYGTMKRELHNNHHKVRKYMLFHDVITDASYSESVRFNWNIEQQSKESGYSEDEIFIGIVPAIKEFLNKHPEWRVKEFFRNNNGLLVLERIGPPKKKQTNKECLIM